MTPEHSADYVARTEALKEARDFLSGLLRVTGMRGYYDPEIGDLVSTRLVLELIETAIGGYTDDHLGRDLAAFEGSDNG